MNQKTHPFCWLDYQDSNLDKQNQNLLCYHYTIVQSLCAFLEKRCKDSAFLFNHPNKTPTFFDFHLVFLVFEQNFKLILHTF